MAELLPLDTVIDTDRQQRQMEEQQAAEFNSSSLRDNYDLTNAALMDMKLEGVESPADFLTLFSKFKEEVDAGGSSAQSIVQQSAVRVQDQEEALVFEALDVSIPLNADPENLDVIARSIDQAASTLAAERASLNTGVGVEAKAVKTNTESVEPVDIEALRKEVVLNYFSKSIADIADRAGIADILENIGNSISLLSVIDIKQLTGEIFGSAEVLQEVRARIQELPLEEQVVVFEALSEHIDEITEGDEFTTTAALELLFTDKEVGLLDPFSDSFSATNLVDIGNSFLGVTKFALNRLKPARVLVRSGKAQIAASMKLLATTEDIPDLQKILKESRAQSADDSVPFNLEQLSPDQMKGLSPLQQREVLATQLAGARTVQDLIAGRTIQRVFPLTKEDQAVAVQKYQDDFMNYLTGEQNKVVDEITVIKDSPTAVTFSAKTQDSAKEFTRTYNFTKDDNGALDITEVKGSGPIRRLFVSPLGNLAGKAQESAQQAIISNIVTPRAIASLQKINAASVAGLSKKSVRKIDDYLIRGDQFDNADGTFGKVFTAEELKLGVYGPKLNDDEVVAYFKQRSIADVIDMGRDAAVRQQLIFNGFTRSADIRILKQGKDGTSIKETINEPVKILESSEEAFNAVRGRNVPLAFYDEGAQVVRTATRAEVDDLYSQGFRLARTNNPVNTGKGSFTNFLVKDTNFKPLPARVTLYQKGWIPRSYTRGLYFAKEVIEGTVDGVDGVVGTKTLRMFDNEDEARLFQQLMKEKDGKDIQILKDKELLSHPDAVTDMLGMNGGGLYTAARSSTGPIPFTSVDRKTGQLVDTEADRLGGFQSINKALNLLGQQGVLNVWRMAQEDKIRKAAQLTNTPLAPSHNLLTTPIQGNERLEAFRKNYVQWSGLIDTDSKQFQATAESIYSKLAPKAFVGRGTLVADSVLKISTKDPIAFAKGIAFHALLGWFNPVQVFVQSQALAVALGVGLANNPFKVNPVNLTAKALAIRAMDFTDDLNEATNAMKVMTKGMDDVDIGELRAAANIWQRIGARESVTATADYSMAAKGAPMSQSMTSRVLSAGLLPFKTGELISRRYAFAMATERWVNKTGKALSKATERDMSDIAVDFNNLMLNMTRANRAGFQKGFFALPTQFAQVMTKFIEAGFGVSGGFTKREMIGIWTAQLALYGSAGVPLGHKVLDVIASSSGDMFGIPAEEFSAKMNAVQLSGGQLEPWMKMAQGGFVDTAFWMLDADVSASKRGGILGQAERNFFIDIITGEKTFVDAFGGASGSVGSRALDAMQSLKSLSLQSFSEEQAPSIDEILFSAKQFFKITATGSQVEKAKMLKRFHLVLNSSGVPITSRDYNKIEELLVGAGFSTADQEAFYRIQEANLRLGKQPDIQMTKSEFGREKREMINLLWEITKLELDNENNQHADAIDELRGALKFRMSSIPMLEQGKMRDAINSAIANKETRAATEVTKFIELIAERGMASGPQSLMQELIDAGEMKREAIFGPIEGN